MRDKETWACFWGDPGNVCENATVRDACLRGAVVKVLGKEEGFAVVEYRGESGMVPVGDLVEREPSSFDWGDKVVIVSKGIEAVIDLICWHLNEEKYYFFLKDPNGKPIKQRYFEDDLKKA